LYADSGKGHGLRPASAPQERLVLDGLRCFEFGQYWPFDVNLLIGQSHFLYGFQDAELRRSGTMTPFQRRKRLRLERRHGRPDPPGRSDAPEPALSRQSRRSLDPAHRGKPEAGDDRVLEAPAGDVVSARELQNPIFATQLTPLLSVHPRDPG
jgi:hypothetical protein